MKFGRKKNAVVVWKRLTDHHTNVARQHTWYSFEMYDYSWNHHYQATSTWLSTIYFEAPTRPTSPGILAPHFLFFLRTRCFISTIKSTWHVILPTPRAVVLQIPEFFSCSFHVAPLERWLRCLYVHFILDCNVRGTREGAKKNWKEKLRNYRVSARN